MKKDITVQECLDQYEKYGKYALINDGQVQFRKGGKRSGRKNLPVLRGLLRSRGKM